MLVCKYCGERLGWTLAYCPFCGKPQPAVVVAPKRLAPAATPARAPTAARPAVVALTKGQNVSLSRLSPGLRCILIDQCWDKRTAAGVDMDLDEILFMTAASGKVRGDADLVFYNQPRSACGAVELIGNKKEGEKFTVKLDLIPSAIERLVVGVTIYDDAVRVRNFGQVRGAYIRIIDADTATELVRFTLAEEYGGETAMIFGEIYRRKGEWKLKAVGQGFSGGLRALCGQFGVSVA
ncbi:TerD family protein [uncultured Thiodictyon sp.]|uniref:TerD family protein n=1 Tax=uncultured Thiodictyon sp. TaxID=1846217 RepID=UPI0025E74923|nr:TerD family protein [uncultured Thiodictyon sp.]